MNAVAVATGMPISSGAPQAASPIAPRIALFGTSSTSATSSCAVSASTSSGRSTNWKWCRVVAERLDQVVAQLVGDDHEVVLDLALAGC